MSDIDRLRRFLPGAEEDAEDPGKPKALNMLLEPALRWPLCGVLGLEERDALSDSSARDPGALADRSDPVSEPRIGGVGRAPLDFLANQVPIQSPIDVLSNLDKEAGTTSTSSLARVDATSLSTASDPDGIDDCCSEGVSWFGYETSS